MKEILPGIWQWSRFSEAKGLDFNGLFLKLDGASYLVDPPPMNAEEEEILRRESGGKLTAVLLTNKDHVRDSAALARRFGAAPVRIHEADAALAEISAEKMFRHGDLLPGGVEVVQFRDGKSPGESALLLRERGVLILGDALIGRPPGKLSFLPPEKYPSGLDKAREGVRALLALPFEAVLAGDGASILEGGKKAVEEALGG